LEQIAQDGWTPDLLFLQGELYRKRGNPRDLVTAATAYLNAIEAGYENPNAWRGLGLSQMRSGAQAEGKQTLKTYIRMAPDAPDASMITLLIGEE
jgi:regulator of sirC expression with transglutaminase-like and TPR domain